MIQRRKPLVRKTPLRRAPLIAPGRPFPAKRRPFLRRVSLRYGQALRLYSKLAKGFKKKHPFCQRCLTSGLFIQTTDVHHRAKRGKYLNDTSLWMPVCRGCHQWIEDHKNEAAERGWIVRQPHPPQPHDPIYLQE